MKQTAPHSSQKGLTLIEILIVVGILSTLFGIGLLSIMNIRVITTNNVSTTVFISDVKNQQVKAMTGDTEGRGTPDSYGVKVLPTQYILFHGLTYNASDATNFSIPITTGFTLSSTFPNNTILFNPGSGTISGFVAGQDTVTITNTNSNQSKTIQFNSYGTVTTIN